MKETELAAALANGTAKIDYGWAGANQPFTYRVRMEKPKTAGESVAERIVVWNNQYECLKFQDDDGSGCGQVMRHSELPENLIEWTRGYIARAIDKARAEMRERCAIEADNVFFNDNDVSRRIRALKD